MADLSINFCGIKSPNPFWLASAPPTNTGAQVMRAFEAGWGGAVWKTLGDPIVNVSSRFGGVDIGQNRLMGLNNIELITDRPLEVNLREIREVKRRFPDRALLVSLMVETKSQWKEIIERAEETGCDGLELNFGCPHGMCERGMGSAVGQEPEVLTEITRWVKEYARTPVLVKLTPSVTDILDPGLAAVKGGADGLSLINTIKSLMGVDLDRFAPFPYVGGKSTNGGFCGPAVKPIALYMVGSLARDRRVSVPISGIGGISNWRDAAEFIALGATSVQVCTAVMHYGYRIVADMIEGLTNYLDEKGMKSVNELRGRAVPNFVDWNDLNMNYKVVASIDPDKCIQCQLCLVACYDGAHQCIHREDNCFDGSHRGDGFKCIASHQHPQPVAGSRVPFVDEGECIGCNLCSLICPVPDCITMVEVDTGKPYQAWPEYQQAMAARA